MLQTQRSGGFGEAALKIDAAVNSAMQAISLDDAFAHLKTNKQLKAFMTRANIKNRSKATNKKAMEDMITRWWRENRGGPGPLKQGELPLRPKVDPKKGDLPGQMGLFNRGGIVPGYQNGGRVHRPTGRLNPKGLEL